jgi:hypothetical protein
MMAVPGRAGNAVGVGHVPLTKRVTNSCPHQPAAPFGPDRLAVRPARIATPFAIRIQNSEPLSSGPIITRRMSGIGGPP